MVDQNEKNDELIHIIDPTWKVKHTANRLVNIVWVSDDDLLKMYKTCQ